MAIQSNIKLRGTTGNIIYYQWNKIDCMRSKPLHINQSAATKTSAKDFGKACLIANNLRSLLVPFIQLAKTRHTRNIFAGTLNRWLATKPFDTSMPVNELPFITGFQFNEATTLKERFKVFLTVNRNDDNTLTLNIPAYIPLDKIAAPSHTQSVKLSVIGCSCNIKDGFRTNAYATEMNIPYTAVLKPAIQLPIPITTAEGSIAILCMVLSYSVKQKGNIYTCNDMQWMPAGIVSAMYN